MVSLEARFDAVQDQLLQVYENDSNTLELCLQYWALIRRENALYYYARQQGKTRLVCTQCLPPEYQNKRLRMQSRCTYVWKACRNQSLPIKDGHLWTLA
uniref:Probable protein E3 n=1 Tax=Bos taurus papillomavirus 4 TaxID=10562 RepID=VE3_BPV4|nr:RecName: Full=Probable protein E3 [Bos taurus papillomavirus 4]